MRRIIEHTHYYPATWRGRLHTYAVYKQFCTLFQLRVKVLAVEMLGVLLVPLVLFFALPSCAQDIVDFVRDATVKDPRVGDICSFATFDVKRHGNVQVRRTRSATATSASSRGASLC